MDYQLSEHQTWVQTLLFIVYQPMVANKVGRYPLTQIISQFAANERAKVKLGIDALIEMSIFVMDGRDICITNQSEALLQGLNHIVRKPADAVEEMLKTAPAFSSTLSAINNDSRFAPPIEPSRDTTRSDSAPPQHTPSPGGKPTGLGDKIVLGIFLVVVLLGLMKLIFRY